jgi:glucose-1-phosphate thymidylyltransferase
VLETRQGFRIACPEEIALQLGWISRSDLVALAQEFAKSDHGKYLLRVAEASILY